MHRPHTESLPSQVLPGREMGDSALRPGAAIKMLSEDDSDGAFSAIVRYPAGWCFDA